MQICGKEIDLEDIKNAQAELEALLKDPELIAQLEAIADDVAEKLSNFKPEIPEVPSLQEALAKLNEDLSSEEFQEAIQKIKQDFGEVVEDLDELIDKVNPKINEFLEELPSSEDINKLFDGSLIGEALAKAQADFALAQEKINRKLAQGFPEANTSIICSEVPNIEVETETIEVEEVRTKVVEGTDVEVEEVVVVQQEVKKKVVAPPEPKVPKEVPPPPKPKPVQRTVEVDPKLRASNILGRSQETALNNYRKVLKDRAKDRKEYKQLTFASVFWFYIEIAHVVGIPNPFTNIEGRNKLTPARFRTSNKDAVRLIPEEDRKIVFEETKKLYEENPLKGDVSFEDAINKRYYIRS